MSESTGPKTWGDVIRQGKSGTYYLRDKNSGGVELRTVEQLAKRYEVTVEAARISVKWVYLGCPPLTDPIPPEADEPVAKVVRWTPTSKDADRFEVDLATWESAFDDRRIFREVFSDAIRDCQRDLPAVEPPTPEDAKSRRIDELERLLVQIGDYAHDKSTGPTVEDGYWEIRSMAYDGIPSDLPPTPPTDRFAALESRLAALENRAILKPDYDPRDVALVSVPRIGKATYNTPTTFEEALMVEPQATPEPEIPLPEGCTEVEGFPLLCLSRKGNVRPRSREYFFLTWSDGHAAWMKACGCSQDEIKQSARYAIGQIARDAGLDVVVK